MAWINWLAVHQRAAPDDAGDACLLARLNRRRRHAPLKRTVEPDPRHASLGRLLYDARRHRGMRHYDDAVQVARNAREVRVAGHAFNLRGIGIHWKHVVAA